MYRLEKRRNLWIAAVAMFLLIGLLSFTRGGPPSASTSEPPTAKPAKPLTEFTLPAKTTQGKVSQPPAVAKTPLVSAPAPPPRPATPPPQPPSAAKPPSQPPPQTLPDYQPKQYKAAVHPTNFGDRFAQDIYGRRVNNSLLVVLHETVGSAGGTINFFQVPHYEDEKQASYHALVTLNGTIIFLVPPEKRAFGAGNSVFQGPNGPETVKTNRQIPPSVNNFAYHISLETPPDGENNQPSHSGYTTAQYQSLAWLVARTRVPDTRITTHKAVDQSGERQDPRSFDFDQFLALLHQYPRPEEVASFGSEPST